jgi:hypothetical protein
METSVHIFEESLQAASQANESGAGKRSRTSDLRITNALLYQLSYSGIDRFQESGGAV